MRGDLAVDQPDYVISGGIVAEDGDQAGMDAECVKVAHHIAGAAQCPRFPLNPQDRDRRLGGNPLDLTVDIMIEHDVADTKHTRVAKTFDAGNRRGRLGHPRADAVTPQNYGHSVSAARKTAMSEKLGRHGENRDLPVRSGPTAPHMPGG